MLSPLVIVFCKIPILGPFCAWCVGRLSEIMIDISAFLSRPRGVMVSLRYPFVKWIILGMTLLLFIMLVVRIWRKRLFLVPAVSAVLSFVICLGVYSVSHRGELRGVHLTDSQNDGFTIVSEGRTLICDVSSGSYNFGLALVLAGKELAVCDVDTFMLTHYHERHIKSFARLSDEIYVRNILLPLPQNKDDDEIFDALVRVAEEKGIDVALYDSEAEEKIRFNSIEIDIGHREYIKRSVQPITAMSFSNGRARLTYIGSSVHESALYDIFLPIVGDSEAIVFGAHGPKVKSSFSYGALSPTLRTVIFSSSEMLDAADMNDGDFASSLDGVGIRVEISASHFTFD